MEFDLKSWSERNKFVYCPYSRRDGKIDGDVVCEWGIITTADDGLHLVAIVSVDDPDDDEPIDFIQAIANVSAKRSTLSSGVYAFEFDPAQLDTVGALMRPCRDEPDIKIGWPAVDARLAWRVERKKAASNA